MFKTQKVFLDKTGSLILFARLSNEQVQGIQLIFSRSIPEMGPFHFFHRILSSQIIWYSKKKSSAINPQTKFPNAINRPHNHNCIYDLKNKIKRSHKYLKQNTAGIKFQTRMHAKSWRKEERIFQYYIKADVFYKSFTIYHSLYFGLLWDNFAWNIMWLCDGCLKMFPCAKMFAF